LASTHRYQRRSRQIATFAFAVMALAGCQSGSDPGAGSGPGCPPLPSASVYIYPYSSAAGADEIRVSPANTTSSASGETVTFTITACYESVHWSVSAPSYVTSHPKSGVLKTGQLVQVTATFSEAGVNTNITVNPGDYVSTYSYSGS
jgi:hypothetical protein